jgi:hypothetical protein
MGRFGVESFEMMAPRQLGGEEGEMIARVITVMRRWRRRSEPGEAQSAVWLH